MEKNKNGTSYFIASIFTSNYSPGKPGKSTSNTHNWPKKSSCYLSTPIPLSSCLHIMNDDFILRIRIFDAEVYRSSSCICSQSLAGKMEEKKKTHTHTQNERDELWVPTSPMYFAWYNFDGKCIRVVHPVDNIFGGLWYNGRKALWWNIQITEERQNFLMCKYGYLPDKVRTNYSQNVINSSKVKLMLLQKESKLH